MKRKSSDKKMDKLYTFEKFIPEFYSTWQPNGGTKCSGTKVTLSAIYHRKLANKWTRMGNLGKGKEIKIESRHFLDLPGKCTAMV